MSGVNKVIIVGNIGKEPEVRQTQGGTSVVNFSIATSEKYKDNQGVQQQKTEWHNIVAWSKLADICAQYLHKGSKVYIEGKLQTRKWQDQSGQDRYTTEIVGNNLQMLGSRNNGQQQAPQPQQGQQAHQDQQPDYSGYPEDDSIPF